MANLTTDHQLIISMDEFAAPEARGRFTECFLVCEAETPHKHVQTLRHGKITDGVLVPDSYYCIHNNDHEGVRMRRQVDCAEAKGQFIAWLEGS